MALRSAEQFVSGLRDGRRIFYRGESVEDVTEHPELRLAVEHAAIEFKIAEDPRFRDLASQTDSDGRDYSAYYRIPRSAEDLSARSRLTEAATRQGATLLVLMKGIGADALFALMRILSRADESQGLERLQAFYERCRDNDLALAVAQTDVKGDRSRRPHEQSDPDLYLRVVDQTADGITVRGAKAHTSSAPYVDHLIVLPSRSMDPEDGPWSVSFTVPVGAPGVTLYASDFLHGAEDSFKRPISFQHKTVETLTVFDDVFVPWDQVFFYDRPDLAGMVALAFVEYHRFTAVSYKLPYLDALVGCAISLAEANGIAQAGHVRDKLTWLAGYTETVRGLVELASLRAKVEGNLSYPDVFTTNMAKWTFARDFTKALEIVQDLAGGLLVTGPSGRDWDAAEIRPVLEKYLRGAWPADRRMAILNLAGDLTTGQFGAYQTILAVHAEGSLEAEKLAMFRSYDPSRALGYVRQLAGLQDWKTE